MLKTSPSNAGGVGAIPARGAKIPHASGLKSQNKKQKHIVKNSIKTLKMVHTSKNLKKNNKGIHGS